MLWATSKVVKRGHILSYTMHKRRKFKEHFHLLHESLLKTQMAHATHPSARTKQDYQEAKQLLKTFLQGNAHWHSKTVQHKLYRWGNKTGSLLVKVTHSHTKYTPIIALRDLKSQALHTTLTKNCETLFNLYRATLTVMTAINTFLSSLSLTHVAPEQQACIDAPVMEDEVKLAIAACSNGKTQTPDGYPG